MKVVASIVVILTLLAGASAPASAFDSKAFFETRERQSGGTGA